MIMNPKISVITICYNAEKEIEKTMRSVLNQSFDDFEYIIVDGASKDGTLSIIREISKEYQDKPIRIYSEPDRGIYDAMNKGVKLAHGTWLNMMNAGDCFHDSNVLSNLFSLDISENISVIYSDSYLVYDNKKNVLVHHSLVHPPYGFCHQAMIYKRCLHQEHGLYIYSRKLIIADTLFLIRLPIENIYKTDIIIADFAAGGASGIAGYTMQKQNLCAQYIFKERTFFSVFFDYYMLRLRHVLIPNGLRQFIRRKLGRIE